MRQLAFNLKPKVLDHGRSIVVIVPEADCAAVIQRRIDYRELREGQRKPIVPIERRGHTVIRTGSSPAQEKSVRTRVLSATLVVLQYHLFVTDARIRANDGLRVECIGYSKLRRKCLEVVRVNSDQSVTAWPDT